MVTATALGSCSPRHWRCYLKGAPWETLKAQLAGAWAWVRWRSRRPASRRAPAARAGARPAAGRRPPGATPRGRGAPRPGPTPGAGELFLPAPGEYGGEPRTRL